MRKIGTRRLASAVPILAAVTITGCFYPAFQTPEALPPGKVSLGLNLAGGPAFYTGPRHFSLGEAEFGLCTRVGVIRGLDAGLRLSVPLGGMVDVKYQFLRQPFLGAADLGFSYFPKTADMWSGDYTEAYIWYPMILAGYRRYYVGLKSAWVVERHSVSDRGNLYVLPGLIAGGSFGRRFRFLPELNVFYMYLSGNHPPEHMLTAGAGVGVQYVF